MAKVKYVLGLLALYLIGSYLWGNFFNWGAMPLDFADWSDITAPRFTFLKDAVNRGEWPLHTSDKSTVGGVTDRYMSIPDAFLSPQVLLLNWLDVGQFALVNILLLYSLGFLGLLRLKRQFDLSFITFLALFALFNFNGHIVAHLSVGHATWGGYFLLPWFAGLVFKLLFGERGWRWAAKVALLLVAILLQGSYHQYVWLLFFLGFLAIARRSYLWTVIRAGLFAILLAMPRLWPPSLVAGEFESRFHGGFVGWWDLWQGLAVIQIPGTYFESVLFPKPLGWWELSFYVGVAGVLFLVVFGFYGWLRGLEGANSRAALLLPLAGMFALSFSTVFAWVREIPFPLFAGERVAARMLCLPLVFIIILATIGFQRWLERPGHFIWARWLIGLAVIAVMCYNLWQNLQTWAILSVYDGFPHEKFIAWMWTLANRYDDMIYIRAIQKGLLAMLASLGLLAGFIWVEKKV